MKVRPNCLALGQGSDANSKPGLLRRFFQLDGASVAIVFVLLILIFMITAPQVCLGYRVYMSVMATVPPPLIIGLGVTLVAVAGEMDLSFRSIVAAVRQLRQFKSLRPFLRAG